MALWRMERGHVMMGGWMSRLGRVGCFLAGRGQGACVDWVKWGSMDEWRTVAVFMIQDHHHVDFLKALRCFGELECEKN